MAEYDILIHACCAPCLCYTMKNIKEKGFSPGVYWYNPNIHAYNEYSKRLMTMGYYMQKSMNAYMIEEAYKPGKWFDMISEYEKPSRCINCYRLRLNACANYASRNKIRCFTSTLLYSKFQYHDMIKEIAEEASRHFNVEFYYADLRQGWKEGISISNEFGLYRQQYCGCLFSEMEKYNVS
ncbi:epoxyqueuosine reductase QueH [Elusimicrobiota bacterium]